MAKNIEGAVNIINTLSQANNQDFPIAMAEDISMNDGSRIEDRINALHNYTHPSTSGYKHIPSGGETDDVLLFKTDGEAQWGKIPDASTTVSGLMSKDDKTKLNGIASGANNYVHPSYTNHTTDLYKVSVDSTGHVSAVTKVIKDDITSLGIPAQDTTYENASSSKAGLMSIADKTKLDGIASGANNYVHPSYTQRNNGLYKITVNNLGHVTDVTSVAKSDITALGIPAQDTTYGEATTAKSGLMSAADKLKLDNVPEEFNDYTHPSYTQRNSGLYKITVDKLGHVSDAIAVSKSDITALGIPAQDTTYNLASSSANGLMSAADKTKLDGIASGANNYTHPSYDVQDSGLYKITVDATGHVSEVTTVSKSDITALGIPAQDTTYGEATTSKSGLMSAADKLKLDNVPEEFNDYSHPTYTERSSGLYKITVDKLGHVSAATPVTKSDITALGIPSSDTNTWTAFKGASSSAAGTAGYVPAPSAGAANRYFRSDGTWAVPPDTNTTYSAATTSTAGLMSAADKSKLDGIASGANNYTHPTYTQRSSGLYKITVNNLGHVTDVTSVAKSDITALGIPSQDTTYAVASTNSNGLMSSSDKTKLDGITAGANKYVHPSYTQKSSGLYKITVDNTGHVSAATAVTKSDLVTINPGLQIGFSTEQPSELNVNDLWFKLE